MDQVRGRRRILGGVYADGILTEGQGLGLVALVAKAPAGEPNTQVDDMSAGIFAKGNQVSRTSSSVCENKVMDLACNVVDDVGMKCRSEADDVGFSVVGKSLEVVGVKGASQIDNVGPAFRCKKRDFLRENVDLNGGERPRLCRGEADDKSP